MWLQSIRNIPAPQWLTENSKQLRVALIIGAVLVCVNVLLYVFFIVPSLSALRTGEAKTAEFRQRHAEAMLFKKQEPHLTGFLSGIPSQKDMPLIVKEFVQLARKLKLTVASAINYDIPQQESGELVMLSFPFPVEGRYPDVKRFIYEMETTDRLIGIQDLKLESDKSTVKLQMRLITYVRGK